MPPVRQFATANRGLVAFALEVESKAVFRVLSKSDKIHLPFPRFNRPTTVHRPGWDWQMCVFGPGEAFHRHLNQHLKELSYKPDFALLAGFSGGLSPHTKSGMAFEVKEVLNPPKAPVLVPTKGIAPKAVSLHSKSVYYYPSEKNQSFHTTGSDLVDMESSYFSQTMVGADIPFGICRSITDGPNESLPRQSLHWVDSNGKIALGRLICDVLRSPGLIRALFRLGKSSKLAGKNLGELVLQAL